MMILWPSVTATLWGKKYAKFGHCFITANTAYFENMKKKNLLCTLHAMTHINNVNFSNCVLQ